MTIITKSLINEYNTDMLFYFFLETYVIVLVSQHVTSASGVPGEEIADDVAVRLLHVCSATTEQL